MSGLSIIIPVLGNSASLDDTLVSVLENRPARCEILVVHTDPYDDPYDLAGEVQFIEADRKASRVECLNRGLAASRSPIVHTLSCGVEVSAGWADAAVKRFRDDGTGAVATMMLARNQRDRILSAGLGYGLEGVVRRVGLGRSPLEIGKHANEFVGADMLAGFYRKAALEAAGGFMSFSDDALTSIDTALRLQRVGFRSVLAPECVVWSDAALARFGSGFRYGRDSERLFWRWAARGGRIRSLAAHAALLAGECTISLWRPTKLAECFGRLWGACRPAAALTDTRVIATAATDESIPPVAA